jgi:hypothetical protein
MSVQPKYAVVLPVFKEKERLEDSIEFFFDEENVKGKD